MKKRILAVLLSALILANVTACNVAPENEMESTAEGTERECESNTTESALEESEEKEPSKDNPQLTLSEYQNLVGCYVTTESGENLENLMRKGAEQIKVVHEGYGSNVFHIKTLQNDTEYQTTIQLSEGVRTPDIYSGFTSEQNGYVIIFHMEGHAISPQDDIELACVLKTADGGKTWDKIEYNDFRVSNSREIISGACFFSENIGFFTARYTNTDHFEPRTYWTVNGGKTWKCMKRLDIPNMLAPFGKSTDFASEIADVSVVDGVYILTVRICHGYTLDFDMGDNGERYIGIYIQYFSTDLEKWTLRKETDPKAETVWKGSMPCNGVYFDSGVTYTVDLNGDLSIHIADWNEDHLVTAPSLKGVKSAQAIGINDERAFLLCHRYYENQIIVASFEKGSPSENLVTLDVAEGVIDVFGILTDENIGYLFAFQEVLDGHARGGSKLSNLLKTEDGGKTWSVINVQNVPSISLQNHIMFAKMVSEDVGLISGNIFGGDYDFCSRTLLTTDGGLNWTFVNIPELPQDDDLPWAVVTDFTQVDGSYILTIRYETPKEKDAYAKYKLTDQNTWIRIN